MNPNPTTPDKTSLTGRRYWRSLDELSDTPEFKEWLHREFPQGASEFNDPVSRRHFVKIMSASFALAGLGLMAPAPELSWRTRRETKLTRTLGLPTFSKAFFVSSAFKFFYSWVRNERSKIAGNPAKAI